MSEFPLPSLQRRQLIDYLVRYGGIETRAERKAFLEDSDLSEVLGNLLGTLPMEGAARDFAHALIDVCQRRGTVDDINQPALVLVLWHLRDIASGHESVVAFVNRLLTPSSQRPSPSPKSNEELLEAFGWAIDHRDASEWNQALDILLALEKENFDEPTLEWLIADTRAQKEKAVRRHRLPLSYRAVAQLIATQSPEVAQQTWNDFLQKNADFDPLTESPSEYLQPPHVEQKQLLGLMGNSHIPPLRRAEAGRELAKIGDPCKAVMTVDGMQFCFIPKGRFWMGSDDSDDLAYPDEKPAAWYEIPYSYWMARFPVTNAQFQTFVEDGGYKGERWWSLAKAAGFWSKVGFKGRGDDKPRLAPVLYDGSFTLGNHPVVGVTWYEGIAFTDWLTKRWHDKGYLAGQERVVLPNEPEWEKAARGGEQVPTQVTMRYAFDRFPAPSIALTANPLPKRRYPYGDEANTNSSSYTETAIGTSSAVGVFAGGASPYGCEEMSGTVWEWSRSGWKDAYPYDTTLEDLTLHNILRVVRGGAFDSNERDVRCAYRLRGNPDDWDDDIGLRLAVVVGVPIPSVL